MKKNKVKIIYIFLGIILILTIVGAKDNSNKQLNYKNNYIMQNSDEWKAPAYADKLVNRLKDLVKASQKGKEIFDVQCAICHGVEGKGDGAAGMGLTPRPADLTSKKVQSQSDGAIYWKITTGKPPMA